MHIECESFANAQTLHTRLGMEGGGGDFSVGIARIGSFRNGLDIYSVSNNNNGKSEKKKKLFPQSIVRARVYIWISQSDSTRRQPVLITFPCDSSEPMIFECVDAQCTLHKAMVFIFRCIRCCFVFRGQPFLPFNALPLNNVFANMSVCVCVCVCGTSKCRHTIKFNWTCTT